jgi:hypothetical protein
MKNINVLFLFACIKKKFCHDEIVNCCMFISSTTFDKHCSVDNLNKSLSAKYE